jgi:hypothetical protein
MRRMAGLGAFDRADHIRAGVALSLGGARAAGGTRAEGWRKPHSGLDLAGFLGLSNPVRRHLGGGCRYPAAVAATSVDFPGRRGYPHGWKSKAGRNETAS